MRLSLCLLTWNELEGCRQDVPRLPRAAFDEVFAIDGGSTDGTLAYLDSQGIPAYAQDAPGYNAAYISAFRRCAGDALVIYHPKGTIPPESLKQFRPLFERGAALVVASRMGPGAVNEEDANWFRPRKWFVRALALTCRVLWKREGTMVWDVLHGYRGMRKAAFEAIDPRPAGLSMDLEMVVRAYRKRLPRAEFPVAERARPAGATHFPMFRTGRRLLGYLARELFRRV